MDPHSSKGNDYRGSKNSHSNTSRNRSHGLNNFRSIRQWNDAGKGKNLVRCKCGVVCNYRTSMTDDNPGRRFMRCGKHLNRRGCDFWEWIDPPMCDAAVNFIPLLRDELIELKNGRSMNDSVIASYENEIRRLQEEVVKLRNEVADIKEIDAIAKRGIDNVSVGGVWGITIVVCIVLIVIKLLGL